MIDLVIEIQAALYQICAKYRVRRLELFGSALDGNRFDLSASDMDFLVEFLPLKTGQRADTFFGLQEALATLFQRPVDLVMTKAIKNPYFLQAIDRERKVLYAA